MFRSSGSNQGEGEAEGGNCFIFPHKVSQVFAKLLFLTRSAKKGVQRGTRWGFRSGSQWGPDEGFERGVHILTNPSIVTVKFKLHCTKNLINM